MDYKNKYLKYKYKYLLLKKGGGLNNNDECYICGEQMDADIDNDNFLELECGHVFHYQCVFNNIDIAQQNKTKFMCPACRAPIINIYKVTENLADSNETGDVKLEIIKGLHLSLHPKIILDAKSNMVFYDNMNEYNDKRIPYKFQKEEEDNTPQMRKLRINEEQSDWDENIFSKEMQRFQLASGVELREVLRSDVSDSEKIKAGFELEKRILTERDMDMGEFNRKVDEFKEFEKNIYFSILKLEDEDLRRQLLPETDDGYAERLNAEKRVLHDLR